MHEESLTLRLHFSFITTKILALSFSILFQMNELSNLVTSEEKKVSMLNNNNVFISL